MGSGRLLCDCYRHKDFSLLYETLIAKKNLDSDNKELELVIITLIL